MCTGRKLYIVVQNNTNQVTTTSRPASDILLSFNLNLLSVSPISDFKAKWYSAIEPQFRKIMKQWCDLYNWHSFLRAQYGRPGYERSGSRRKILNIVSILLLPDFRLALR